MILHKEKNYFDSLLTSINNEYGFPKAIIEKDYFVTMFLEKLNQKLPNMIFKGGTSLSKCFKVVKRFSEDIDITVDHRTALTQGQYKKIKKAVVDTVEELKMTITNIDDTRSRRDFNRYLIDYNATHILEGVKPLLVVETSMAVRSFPAQKLPVKSIVQEYLEQIGAHESCKEYGLNEFEVSVQSLNRTLIDKLFALGDYYLANRETGYARHVYDIYMILPLVVIDDNFRLLLKEVRELRKESKYCRSAQDGVDMQMLLEEIISKDFYKGDYESTFTALLYEKIAYKEAKKALVKIAKLRVF